MEIYKNIARLLNYPSGDYQSTIGELYSSLEQYGSSAIEEFKPVAEQFSTLKTSELQEYYIRTFDVNASCYLDIGYVLFGEESKRGQFLLQMKSEQLKTGNDCGTEFPDYLPNILTLLPKIEDKLFKEELIITILLPALKLMIENFSKENNYYKNIMKILVIVFETNYPDTSFKPYEIKNKESECIGAYSCGIDFTKLKNYKKN
jgi:nitrate reductase molybdenum cofactor assembly chaperone